MTPRVTPAWWGALPPVLLAQDSPRSICAKNEGACRFMTPVLRTDRLVLGR